MEELPRLHMRGEFEAILNEYAMSDRARNILAQYPLVAVSGLAGGGRNTVIRYLAEQHNYIFVVSDTTRPPKLRSGRLEENGVDYYFRSEQEMLNDLRSGEFIEAELIHNQQVSGVSVHALAHAGATGRIPIHDFEYKGADAVASAKQDAVVIALLPPSFGAWIDRFRSREDIEEQEYINRLVTAWHVLDSVLSKDYFKIVINDTIGQCAADIRKIVENGVYSDEQHAQRLDVVRQLKIAVDAALAAVQS